MNPLLFFVVVAAQDTVRFTPTVAQPTFAVREPVLRVKPGTVLVSNTMHGPYYTEQGGAFPGEVGPIWIEGATPNDVLVVRILRVRPNTDLAAAQLYADFGGLATDGHVRLLNDPIPARRYLRSRAPRIEVARPALDDAHDGGVGRAPDEAHGLLAGHLAQRLDLLAHRGADAGHAQVAARAQGFGIEFRGVKQKSDRGAG